MNTSIKLLNPVSNCTRIQNCIEDYIASLYPFNLQISWNLGKLDYKYPDKPDDGSIGYIAFNVSGKDRLKLKTTRYLTRKCKLNEVASLNNERIRILAEKINSLLWTVKELNDVELIHGSDITEAYYNKVGGSSCMTGSSSDYTKLYETNPTRFEMLTMRNDNDSARAIIHKLDNNQKLLGVIYATAKHLCDKMEDYARQQGWILVDVDTDKSMLIMSGLNYCNGEIPYMDVLTSGEICGGLLTASYNSGNFDLQTTDGTLDDGYQCETCGDYVSEDDLYRDDDETVYCEHCFNENFICCPDCEGWVHNNDAVLIQGKEIYACQYCADKNYHSCETCGDYYTLDDMQILDNSAYCERCFDDIAGYCENCNETFLIEELTSVNDSRLLCADCITAIQESKGVIL